MPPIILLEIVQRSLEIAVANAHRQGPRVKSLLILLCGLLPVSVSAEPRDRTRLHVALTCSAASDVGDLLSTFAAFDQRPGAVEGNFWAYGVDTTDRGRFIAVKALGAGVFHGILVWRHDDNPVVSEVLLWSNCAWKGFNTGRNLWIARGGTPGPRAVLAVKVAF